MGLNWIQQLYSPTLVLRARACARDVDGAQVVGRPQLPDVEPLTRCREQILEHTIFCGFLVFGFRAECIGGIDFIKGSV
jgi:hypothetical protein